MALFAWVRFGSLGSPLSGSAMPSLAESMGLPAIAGGIAVCFSHPLELTKTRLQLDNEMAMRGTPRKYTGWTDCVAKSWRADGVRGLQRALAVLDPMASVPPPAPASTPREPHTSIKTRRGRWSLARNRP